LAFAREGYRWGAIRPRDFAPILVSRGFLRLARRLWPVGVREAHRSLDRNAFLRDLQRMLPALERDDLLRGGAGVRAQAVGVDGSLCDDFVLARSPRALHVVNAPSPAATSSLAIAEEIVSRMPATF
ncbi:hydroxyglutarate oxidase, partial [mine drainage metagenome]